MKYYNFLTTPSGDYCEVHDITIQDYFDMVRFIESQNYKGFFQCLDEVVIKSIPNFDDFGIIDKCYVYLAMCMYSIRSSVEVNNVRIGNQQVKLAQVLQNIENDYTKKQLFQYELRQGVVLFFDYPKTFSANEKIPQIDWFSGLKKLNDQQLSRDKVEMLKKSLRAKDLINIEMGVKQHFVTDCDLFRGIPMNSLIINLCSQSIIMNVVLFYKYNLESFYATLYACCKHLKISFDNLMKRSMVQVELFMSFAKKQNEQLSKNDNSGLARMAQTIDD